MMEISASCTRWFCGSFVRITPLQSIQLTETETKIQDIILRACIYNTTEMKLIFVQTVFRRFE